MAPRRSLRFSRRFKLYLDKGLRSIVGNGLRLMLLQWIEAAVGAAYFAAIARYLGPVGYGHLAYGFAAYQLAMSLVGFGLDALVIVGLGKDRHDAGGFIGLTLALRLGLLGLGAIGLILYGVTAAPEAAEMLVLLLLVPALVGRGVAMWARACFLGYERVRDYLDLVVLLRLGEAGCGILYLVAGGGLIGVVLLHVLFAIAEALLGLWRMRTRLTPFRLCFTRAPALRLLSNGAILGVAGAGYMWLDAGPIMLLGHGGLALALLGQFAVARSLTMILVGSGHAFFVAALPMLSRATTPGRHATGYGRLTLLVSVVASAAAAGIAWMVGPPLVELALGSSYAVAGALLPPYLLIGALLLALSHLAGGACLAAGFFPAVAAWGLDGALAATAAGWLVRGAVLIGAGEFDAFRQRQLTVTVTVPVVPGKDQLA